jgi:DNA-binding transcriptional LysR family regulator
MHGSDSATQFRFRTETIVNYDRSVELRQLECVEAVARHRHFTRAAEELHLAQSALSHQVRQLERELGTPLFERTSRRVTTTQAGQVIAGLARRVSAELAHAREEVDELREVIRGRIWIGPLVPAGDVDVPGLLAGFGQAYPGIEIGLREGIASDLLTLVATDELDAAFCLIAGEPPDGLAVERLGHEEVVAAFAPDRAPKARSVNVTNLSDQVLVAPRHGSAITSVLEAMFRDADKPLRLALESGDPFLLRALAARGFATAILPRSLTEMAGPSLEVRSLRPAIRLPVVLAWRRERSLAPAARRFIEFVRAQAIGTT